MANPRTYFDLTLNNEKFGRLVFELFEKEVPKTAKNFIELCSGENGNKFITGSTASAPLSYKGTIFHRIINDFMSQGGDFTNHNGTGGLSIYGAKFNDENFNIKHTEPGMLSMANAGPNTNGSQFFITFVPCPWLDGKHTVFGRVVEGKELLAKLNNLGTSSGKPKAQIKIVDCGKL